MRLAFLPAASATLFAACLIGASPAVQAQLVPAPENVVNLSASASVELPNDLLSVVFSTRREGPDAGMVQAQLKLALDAALAEARRVAVPDKLEVRTGNFALNPRYSPTGVAAGWLGEAELIVEGLDVEAIAALTGRVQTMTVARVGWSLSRDAGKKVEDDVTAQAVADFRAKADRTARQFGFTGWLLREVSVDGSMPRPYAAAPMMMQSRAAGAEMKTALPVEAGRSTVTASVSGSVQLTR